MKQLITGVSLVLASSLYAVPAKITKAEYVDTWKETAIQQMVEYGVPASITLAQGILESGSGNSALAIKGNNHFGIKCHGWTGKKMYKDDDKKNECFRVYKNADESYKDHSEFLKSYERYAFLFAYDVTDYKAWAKGLKKAGYATNPTYPEKLIKIIEELDLAQYDKVGGAHQVTALIASSEQFMNTHKVVLHESKVKYVVAKKGDTFYKISKEFGLNLKQLYRYNDFDTSKDVLVEGDIVYIQPKKRRKLFKRKEVKVGQVLTMNELSQLYASNKKTIKRLNGFTDDTVVSEGDMVTLR
jgi:LysM repeat protein